MRTAHTLICLSLTLGLSFSSALVDAPAAKADSCNTTSWTWPLCEIRMPSIPQFQFDRGRPALTPKNSAWCTKPYILASSTGYIYWALTQNQKIRLRFWPDYYSRYYQAMYWAGGRWNWVPVNPSYPNVILGQRVYCDA